jgi:Flp pilus assembly protein TadG
MIRRLRSLLAANDGAAIIELAMVAPVLALMTVGVVDLSNGFGRKLVLEQGVQRAVEKVMQTTGVLSVENTITNEVVCQVNGTNEDGSCKTLPITAANVTVSHRLECEGVISTTDLDGDGELDCAAGEGERRWIQVRVWSDYEPVFPLHFTGIDTGGKYRIQAVAGMRTH